MNDIVDRLRDPQLHAEIKFMRAEAAAEIVRLRKALRDIDYVVENDQRCTKSGASSFVNAAVREAVRDALTEASHD